MATLSEINLIKELGNHDEKTNTKIEGFRAIR